jgi:hypothetical protein
MKRLALIVTLTILSAACGGSPNSGSAANSSGTQLSGAWTITATENGSSGGIFSVTLVASQWSVATPVGTFTVQGSSCFIADDNTGQGAISGSGQFFYPPQGVLVGSSTNPVPPGSTAQIDLLFVEANQVGDIAVFGGNGVISNGTMTGTWACNPSSPICFGLSGTFSGGPN